MEPQADVTDRLDAAEPPGEALGLENRAVVCLACRRRPSCLVAAPHLDTARSWSARSAGQIGKVFPPIVCTMTWE